MILRNFSSLLVNIPRFTDIFRCLLTRETPFPSPRVSGTAVTNPKTFTAKNATVDFFCETNHPFHHSETIKLQTAQAQTSGDILRSSRNLIRSPKKAASLILFPGPRNLIPSWKKVTGLSLKASIFACNNLLIATT